MAVGSNVAPNLAGMFAEINKGLATDKTGEMYVDTFRRSMAPPIDMNDSASILRYAQWAQKNGYEEEARNYLALGYRQKEKEASEAKQSRSRMGESANMYNRRRISDIASDSSLDPEAKKTMIRQAMEAQQAVAKATGISPTTWDSGTAALAAVNKEQEGSQYNTKVNNIQNVITEAERKADAAPESEKAAFEESLDKLYERLNNVSAEKGERLGDSMRDARRARQREDAADLRSTASGERDQIRLDYAVAAARATQAEAEAISKAEAIATKLIGTGQYEIPEEYVDALPPKTVIEANKLLDDQRKRDEARDESRVNGTVQPATLERAKILAETDNAIATLLNNYETVKGQAVTGKASVGPATALTDAVIARDKATAEAGRDIQISSAVGGKMQALLDQGSYSSWLDGFDDYAEVMADDEQFIEMRNAVSALAKQQGLTPDQITPDVLDKLMDTAAKGLSPEWRKAEQRRSRMRNKALTGWQRTLNSDGMTYRKNVVKEYSGKTQWLDEELDEIAEEHYQEAIDFYTGLIAMPVEEQQKLLFRSLVSNDSIFKPKEIGATGSFMPPIMELEEGQKLYDFVAKGNKLTINNFMADEE